jgi:hypothetical protein
MGGAIINKGITDVIPWGELHQTEIAKALFFLLSPLPICASSWDY